jgi:O-succinylbenzoic acid--CoA ligase
MMFKYSFSIDYGDASLVEQIINDFPISESFDLRSSGSTGDPKSIEISRDLINWSVEQTVHALSLKDEEVLCALPVNKTGGFMQLIRALSEGWIIHFVTPSANPLKAIDLDHQFTLTSFSPQQLAKSIKHHPEKLAKFRTVLVGGARITKKLLKKIEGFIHEYPGTKIYETYGMTETASHIAIRSINQKEEYLKPQLGVIISTEDGRIRVQIPELYLDIKTTDIGSITTSGFRVLGRADDVINNDGVKVHPVEIENKLGYILEEAGISRSSYITKKVDSVTGEMVVLVIEGEPIKDVSFLLELMRRSLPKAECPREIIFEQKFDFTDTVKIIRKEY